MINPARTVILDSPVEMSVGKMIIKRIEKLSEESGDPIVFFICTYGGCCRTMLAIRDAMKRSRCKINTIAIGKAMSAGCYLLLTGGATGTRAVTKDCQVMIHGPNGSAPLTDKGMQQMQYYYDIIREHIEEDTGFTEDEILKLVDRDFYFMGDRAVELGFADIVL